MIRFIVSLLIALGLSAGYIMLVFENAYTLRNISDALFIVGLFLFFSSLIAVTDAAKVFIGFTYTFKNMFKRHREKYSNFYDYSKAKEARKSSFGLGTLFISILFLTTAVILALQYMN